VYLSGQDIEINVDEDVAGNGNVGNNGQSPFNGEVVDNSISVRGNSNIGTNIDISDVAGARNDENPALEVKNNRTIIDTGGKIWGYVFGGGSLGESNKVELIRGEV
jgi:hypothetical protein